MGGKMQEKEGEGEERAFKRTKDNLKSKLKLEF